MEDVAAAVDEDAEACEADVVVREEAAAAKEEASVAASEEIAGASAAEISIVVEIVAHTKLKLQR